MDPLHQQAQQMPNPSGTTWQDLIKARYVGTIPKDTLYDRVCLVVVVIEEITRSSSSVEELSGHFEYSPAPPCYTMRELSGTIESQTRSITLRETRASSDSEPEAFVGQLSENGRLMTLSARWRDGTTSNPFHLGHEDTIADLIPD